MDAVDILSFAARHLLGKSSGRAPAPAPSKPSTPVVLILPVGGGGAHPSGSPEDAKTAGIVIGSLAGAVLVLLLIAGLCSYCRRRVEAHELASSESAPADIEAPPAVTSSTYPSPYPAIPSGIQLCEGMNQPMKSQDDKSSSDSCHAPVFLAPAHEAK